MTRSKIRLEEALLRQYDWIFMDLKTWNDGLRENQITKEKHAELTSRTNAELHQIDLALRMLKNPGMTDKVIQPMGRFRPRRT